VSGTARGSMTELVVMVSLSPFQRILLDQLKLRKHKDRPEQITQPLISYGRADDAASCFGLVDGRPATQGAAVDPRDHLIGLPVRVLLAEVLGPAVEQVSQNLAVAQVEGLQRAQLVGPGRDDLLAVRPAERALERVGDSQRGPHWLAAAV